MCCAPASGGLPIRDVNAGCHCSSTETSTAAVPKAEAGEVSETFLVAGMTCGHCVASVSEELAEVAGVKSVAVNLVAGGTSEVIVSSERPLDSSDVDAAVREAGYELVSR